MSGLTRGPRRTDHAYDKTDLLLLGGGAVLVLIGLALAADSWFSPRGEGAAPSSGLVASADSARQRFLRRGGPADTVAAADSTTEPTARGDSVGTIPSFAPSAPAPVNTPGASSSTAPAASPATGSTVSPATATTAAPAAIATGPNKTSVAPAATAPASAPAAAPSKATSAMPAAAPAGSAGKPVPGTPPTTAPTIATAPPTSAPSSPTPATAAAAAPKGAPTAPTAAPSAPTPAAPAPRRPLTSAVAGEVGSWSVQAGAFGSRENADRLAASIGALGFRTKVVETGPLHRVRAVGFTSQAAADSAKAKIATVAGSTLVVLPPAP